MKKLMTGSAVLAPVASIFAQSSSVIDTTALASNVTQIQSDVSGFFSSSVGPAVLAILGGAFLIWLTFVIFRWVRRAAK